MAPLRIRPDYNMETLTLNRITPTAAGLDNPWVVCSKRNPQARVRLFCFPYAGGGASIFGSWHEQLPPEIEVCAVQPPGRERRLLEPAYDSLPPLVVELARVLDPYMDIPFVFFGHSMGSLIAFELARYLHETGGRPPEHLFVSGHRAPHLHDEEPPIYLLPEPGFLEELRRLEGTPEEVLNNAELMQLLMPALRADFTLCGTYVHGAEGFLDCPISAFGGLQDPKATAEQLAEWADHTSGSFKLRMFPGNHFFVHSERSSLLQTISDEIAPLLSGD